MLNVKIAFISCYKLYMYINCVALLFPIFKVKYLESSKEGCLGADPH